MAHKKTGQQQPKPTPAVKQQAPKATTQTKPKGGGTKGSGGQGSGDKK